MTQSILITGANRGIGLELAQQFAADGWRVLGCCRRPEKAEELQNLATKRPGQVSIHALDVSQSKDIARLAEELQDEPSIFYSTTPG
jgi:NAD(P)-dependent dehydrogenase (short-subunit alcohol dehydrogenase family)